ncbi:hypothetical protein ACFSCW_04720 [Sphingomonas tabacisoli]|uniref:Uncharacterized protein n=1 Tax=Sphingomonas tabacisoli TaxID=2249466 RepID=A0ABW4I0Y8_9SPHN
MTGRLKLALGAVLAAALLAPAVAAPRLSPEARLDKAIGDRVPGKPVSCINLRDIQSSEIIDKTAIVYRVGSKLYVNRPHGANWLDDDDILVTKTVTGQLCRIDTVTLIDRTSRFQRGFVTLADFVPYTRR